MFGWDDIAGNVLKIIDKIIPYKAEAEKAKLAFYQAQQQGELEEVKTALSAIIAEAQSADQWTSRARPSFLYVVYTLILASLPMAVVYVYSPETAQGLVDGFHKWLDAIPDKYIDLFGIGYLGYTGARSLDKWKKRK